MPMFLATIRTDFENYLALTDTVERVISNTDRDYLINEAHLDYSMKFIPRYRYSQDVTTAANPLTWKSETTGYGDYVQQIEGVEWKSGGIYYPLKRSEERSLALLRATEDAIGTPTTFGAALQSHNDPVNLLVTQSGFKIRIYPRLTGSQTYRIRYVRFAPVMDDSDPGTSDVAETDDGHGRHVALIAAIRAGAILGYSDEWQLGMYERLPAAVRQLLNNDYLSSMLTKKEELRWVTRPGQI